MKKWLKNPNQKKSKLHREVTALLIKKFPSANVVEEFHIEVEDSRGKPHHLYIDLMVPSMNLAVECQGRQHFEPVKHFHQNSGFETSQSNDRLKRTWCEINDVILIEFRFDEKVTMKLLEKKIKEALNG